MMAVASSERCLGRGGGRLVLSEIHSSLTSSFVLGWMRITSPPRVSTLIAGPQPSRTSTDGVERYSQERLVKALGLDVSAPTGHKSTTFPGN